MKTPSRSQNTLQTSAQPGWKNRYFELVSGVPRELHYYRNTDKTRQLGAIRLPPSAIITPYICRYPLVIAIRLPKRTYYLKARDQQSYDDWLKILQGTVVKDIVSGYFVKRGKSKLHQFASREYAGITSVCALCSLPPSRSVLFAEFAMLTPICQ